MREGFVRLSAIRNEKDRIARVWAELETSGRDIKAGRAYIEEWRTLCEEEHRIKLEGK